MSRISEADYTCGKCGHVSKQRLFDSVNVTLDAGLREKVMSGDVFCMTCPSCGDASHAQYDCLYHDMKHAFMIQLTGVDRMKKIADTLAEATKQMTMRDHYRMRIVTSVHDMMEKVLVFEAGLNDGIVEIIKALLPGQDESLAGATLRFEAMNEKGELAFAIVKDEGKPQYAVIQRALYDDLKEKAFQDMFAHTDARGQWLTVDVDAIGSYLATK
jgi:hypothetical protein